MARETGSPVRDLALVRVALPDQQLQLQDEPDAESSILFELLIGLQPFSLAP